MSANKLEHPDRSSDARIRHVAAPVKGATDLPAQLYHDHDDAIAHGVAALLYAQPDRPWSDLLSEQDTTGLSLLKAGVALAGSAKSTVPGTQVEFHNPPRKHTFFLKDSTHGNRYC